MAGKPSTEAAESLSTRWGRKIGRAARELGPNDKIAALGGLVVCGSMLLPWYGAPIANDLVQTGAGAFSFSTAALLLTVGAALFLLLEVGSGYRPPRPLSVGGLLIACGAWAALIVVFQMADRPQFNFAGVDDDYHLRYGIFVAFAGAATIALAGVQRSRHEYAGRLAHADDDLDDVGLDEDEEHDE